MNDRIVYSVKFVKLNFVVAWFALLSALYVCVCVLLGWLDPFIIRSPT